MNHRGMWVTVALVVAVAGCGGGGDGGTGGSSAGAMQESAPIQTTGPDKPANDMSSASKPFLGVWKSIAGCSSNWDLVPATDSGKGSFLIGDVTFTETSMAREYRVFSDGNCTQLTGTVTYNYDLVWNTGSVAGWSEVARVDARFNRYDVSNSSIELDADAKEVVGSLSKTILAIKLDAQNKWLYWADNKSDKDADAYPTALRDRSEYYRSRN